MERQRCPVVREKATHVTEISGTDCIKEPVIKIASDE